MNRPCTCPEPLSHIAELCETCETAYLKWLTEEACIRENLEPDYALRCNPEAIQKWRLST